MKTPIVKHSIVVAGQKTSVSLEDTFWLGLKAIAESEHATLREIVESINARRGPSKLSPAIRQFILEKSHATRRGVRISNG